MSFSKPQPASVNGNLASGFGKPPFFSPNGQEIHNQAIDSAAVALSGLVPAGTLYVVIQVKNAAANYTMDGLTTPTASVGFNLDTSTTLTLAGADVIANFKIIGLTGATMDVGFYK